MEHIVVTTNERKLEVIDVDAEESRAQVTFGTASVIELRQGVEIIDFDEGSGEACIQRRCLA